MKKVGLVLFMVFVLSGIAVAGKIDIIRTEITADPLSRGYAGMTDLQVADDMNLVNREAEGGTIGMLSYLLKNRSRTNLGDDIVAISIYGRLQTVAESNIGDDPFGIGAAAQLTREHIYSAKMFIALINSPQLSTMDFVNSEVTIMLDILAGSSGNGRVWKTGDVTAIKALSENQQSRASELGISKVREGNIQEARL